MSAHTVRILCALILSVQAMTAVASACGWLLCTHADGTAHLDRHDADGRCETDASPHASSDVSCTGLDVPLDAQRPKPAVSRGPADQAVAVDWAAACPFVAGSLSDCGHSAPSRSVAPNPPHAARAGVVLLT